MLHAHFLNHFGMVCHKSPESYGGGMESVDDQTEGVSEDGGKSVAKRDAVGMVGNESLLPSEVDDYENFSGTSEHGTLVSGVEEDPEKLREKLREMLR
jgi:hypothetical protein